MLGQIDLSKILFLDIETVSKSKDYKGLNEDFQELWMTKSKSILRRYDEEISEEEAEALYPERAAIYAEFGKIICISVGIVIRDGEGRLSLRLKSFSGTDEPDLLQRFAELVNQYYNDPNRNFFCGHNIREFDIPYICRRFIVNQLPIPQSLNLAGKKPWETKHLLDTLELWKFGDRKSYTSLNLLAALLDFPTPKGDMDGSQVGRVFWEEGDLERIAHYCEKDVLAVVQLFMRYLRQPLLEEEQVIHVDMDK